MRFGSVSRLAISVLFMLVSTSCGSTDSHPLNRLPIVSVSANANQLKLVDESGSQLIDDKFAWNKANQVIFDGFEAGPSSVYIERKLFSKLKPIGGGVVLKLPLYGTLHRISEWKALELSNGEIFITGGFSLDANTGPLNQTWFFDPSANRVRKGPDMRSNRSSHYMILLESGRVLVIGGRNETGDLKSCEVYESSSGRFKEFSGLNLPRSDHSAARLSNGEILVVGGQTDKKHADSSDMILAAAEVWSPKTGQFDLIGRMMFRRKHPVIVPIKNGQAVIGNGYTFESFDYLPPEIYVGLSRVP